MTIDERKQRLYDATRQGAEIIKICHSGAAAVIDTNKKFSIRDEKQPSACVLSPKGNRTTYEVKDYGLSGRESKWNPIDFYMYVNGMNPINDFMMALEQLEHQFGCAEMLSPQDNRYEFRQCQATDEQRQQGYGLEPMGDFTKTGTELWGPDVTADTLRQLGWQQLKSFWWYSSEKNMAYQMIATDRYSIFAQQCEYYDESQKRHIIFYKVYQPFNFDKQFRFRYLGKVPPRYIFCLDAVKQMAKTGKGKLPEVLVVSGCSDCVNAWAAGYPAVYGMSETDGCMPAILKALEPLAERVILIPDIDETGMREGKRLALDFPQLYTAWMTPQDMGGLTDNRGNQKKDLKDFRSLHRDKWDVKKLIDRALPAQIYETLFDKEGNFAGYKLQPVNIYYYLWLKGYCVRRNDEQNTPEYIHIKNHIVSRVSAEAIRNALMEDSRQKGVPLDIQNKLSTSNALPTDKKSFLWRVDGLDFTKATADAQSFYYQNGFVEVTATSIKFRQMSELKDRYVWDDSIIPHNIRIFGDLFTIEHRDDGSPVVSITDEGLKCNLLTLLHNTSRLHWRKVDEQGVTLTPQEEAEEQLCLYVKLVNLGYLCYTRKILSEAYLTLFVDYKLGESVKEANGGTGKSTVLKFIEHVTSNKTIRSYNTKLFDSNFFFAGVHESHDLLILDDCVKELPWAYLNNAVTDALTVEAKHKDPVTIPFSKSPKIVAATNHVVTDESPSIQRRQWPVTYSDFYHHKTRKNDYLEERTVADTFGRTLFDPDYPEQDWIPDLNLMMQCVRLYLSLPAGKRKVMPPMKVIDQRIDQSIMGDRFIETAESLLFPGSELLDKKVLQGDMKLAFDRQGYQVTSAKSLTQKLKAFCSSRGYVFNPASVTKKDKDGETWQCKVPIDGRYVLMTCYYIQSAPVQEAEPELNFTEGDAAPF